MMRKMSVFIYLLVGMCCSWMGTSFSCQYSSYLFENGGRSVFLVGTTASCGIGNGKGKKSAPFNYIDNERLAATLCQGRLAPRTPESLDMCRNYFGEENARFFDMLVQFIRRCEKNLGRRGRGDQKIDCIFEGSDGNEPETLLEWQLLREFCNGDRKEYDHFNFCGVRTFDRRIMGLHYFLLDLLGKKKKDVQKLDYNGQVADVDFYIQHLTGLLKVHRGALKKAKEAGLVLKKRPPEQKHKMCYGVQKTAHFLYELERNLDDSIKMLIQLKRLYPNTKNMFNLVVKEQKPKYKINICCKRKKCKRKNSFYVKNKIWSGGRCFLRWNAIVNLFGAIVFSQSLSEKKKTFVIADMGTVSSLVSMLKGMGYKETVAQVVMMTEIRNRSNRGASIFGEKSKEISCNTVNAILGRGKREVIVPDIRLQELKMLFARFCGACNSCGASSRHRCSKCGIVCYCSKVCQKRDWGEHKKICAYDIEKHIFVYDDDKSKRKFGCWRQRFLDGLPAQKCRTCYCFMKDKMKGGTCQACLSKNRKK